MTDDGICLLHTIGSVDPPGPTTPFIQRRIFPGGRIPSLSDLVNPIEKTGLILADCETLIHHYDKTLNAWLERFLKNKERQNLCITKNLLGCGNVICPCVPQRLNLEIWLYINYSL